MDIYLSAIGLVGLVVIAHAAPFKLMHWCGFCMSFWLALGYFGGHACLEVLTTREAMLGLGLTAVTAGLVAVYTPLFRSSVLQNLEPPLVVPKSEQETEQVVKPRQDPTSQA